MDSVAGKKKSSGSSSMLAPGFRFHPTDEELVRYYLRRKVCGKGFRFDAISEIDIYKAEPWDLPRLVRVSSSSWLLVEKLSNVLDKKYGNGARTNRATEKGYWKTTGKDRAVYHKTQIVGMKKTLVYHSGRAPKGQRTNWVMHEYRLADLELEKAGIVQVLDLSKLPVSISLEKDAFVLCRVFQKSGSGPKNGEQYGAPFVEEEWDDDELELVPKEEAAEEVDFVDDAYLDGDDLEQELNGETEKSTLPSGQIDDNNDNDAASPSDKQDSAKYESDIQYPFIKQASHMLGSIPAPPSFAAEFPSKSTALRLNSLSQPSSSVHVTAGMIQIRNLTTDGNGRVQSFGKPENFNIVLSFGFSRGNDGSASLESSVSILPGKTLSTLSRGWFCFIFFWVLILSMSFKIGTCICAK
ncbi:UNVERIFIED_CONTAM: NAC domain-containing protein 78 [Sesamum latifolium]|uniref:NAC domain-containing protein 78 n=1 Tax=Sesamum latifolium TaxID=2727402 RepID=A0AAW2TD46_9LAMI